MLDGEGSGLEVCDLKDWAVSMEFAAELTVLKCLCL